MAAYGMPFPLEGSLPEEWDELQAPGMRSPGRPSQVRGYIAAQVEAAGATYFVCDHAAPGLHPGGQPLPPAPTAAGRCGLAPTTQHE